MYLPPLLTSQEATQLECSHAFVESWLIDSPPSYLEMVWFWDLSPYGINPFIA